MSSTLPRWSKLKAGDAQKIQQALKQAESKTSGEIVPMMVRSSSPVSHLPHVLFCWLLIIWLLGAPSPLRDQALPAALSLVGLVGLALLLARVSCVQRWLTRLLHREDFVMTRARLEFYEFNVGHTSGATGILIMASMMERQVVVLADTAISEKLPPETWQKVCDLLVSGLRRGEVAGGFLQAIELCGELLREHFPKAAGDINELSDHFLLKE